MSRVNIQYLKKISEELGNLPSEGFHNGSCRVDMTVLKNVKSEATYFLKYPVYNIKDRAE